MDGAPLSTKDTQLRARYVTSSMEVLIDFQFIEEALKMYLSNAFSVVARDSAKVPFKYDFKSIGKDSLGRLVERFGRFNGNAQLIDELRDLVPKRNFIAHQSFLLSHCGWQGSDFESQVVEIEQLHARAKATLKSVLLEVKGVELILTSSGV